MNIFYRLACKALSIATILSISLTAVGANNQPWKHGPLTIDNASAYFKHTDGTPFFWLADTGWLLPERLNRDEAATYLQNCAQEGFNVVQVQTINGVPAYNIYGKSSHPNGWDLSNLDNDYGYWDHMDYIVDTAADNGIYIGMVCIWGGLVKHGDMDVDQAHIYGKFLADRYKDKPNIVWIIGGDLRGDIKPEVWTALAETIKANDPNHIMTYHPFGRTSSATWWNSADWLDFNMCQSGHRAYDQTKGDGDDTTAAAFNEDNWRYIESALAMTPRKPILDGEPSYEDIPHGLHDPTQPRWNADDVRRYAYWAVFAGAAGHTYGNNSLMQMLKPGVNGGYGATRPWYDTLGDEGRTQMKHLKNLILSFGYFDRVPDQSVIPGENGFRYDRAIACRGNDYIMVYCYTDHPVTIDASKLGAKKIKLSVFDPRNGSTEEIMVKNNSQLTTPSLPDLKDRVYILQPAK